MSSTTRNNLLGLLGPIPKGTSKVRRARIHQGWWRTFVLGLSPGERQDGKGTVCNMLPEDAENLGFLTQKIRDVVDHVVKSRDKASAGAMEEKRLRRNLLSSQPLCFNFFAPLDNDETLALQILKNFFPRLTSVTAIHFEFGEKKYTKDRSAFDIAIEGKEGKSDVLIGLECKYTESFSQTKYDNPAYKKLFKGSTRWLQGYSTFTKPRYNQLFRNQLMAEGYLQDEKQIFVRVYTGLFCHEDDSSALKVADEFQSMLREGKECFHTITFRDFITAVQKLDVPDDVREWSMMLWARYCATQLSEAVRG